MSEPWYPPSSAYYVPTNEAAQHPLRQGDLVGPVLIDGEPVPLVQIVHPTCELGKKSVARIQACTVEQINALSDDMQRASVVAGMREKEGRFMVAFAHTFFLPPMSSGSGAMFTDFRQLHLIDRTQVSLATRLAAMTHDCRVYFMRRWLYFRFRILLSLQQVRSLEAERIRADPAFEEPRPPWAL